MCKKNLSPELRAAIEIKITEVISSFNETASKKLKKTISKNTKAIAQDYSSVLKKLDKKAKKELGGNSDTTKTEVIKPAALKRTIVKTTDKTAQPGRRSSKVKKEPVAASV